MTVLQAMLEWSVTRPPWQRDALRRFVQQDTLAEDDIQELLELCKTQYGLHTKNVVAEPLAAEHLPATAAASPVITLNSLTHDGNVNALKSGETLKFGPSLTVIYGDNGAGKSGYARILKHACRARASQEILTNVFSDTAPGAPTATIEFSVGTEAQPAFQWTSDAAVNDHLARISVFDTPTAAIYVRDKTDVAYRPFGLDLFDRLAAMCQTLRARLDAEREQLQPGTLPDIPAKTKAGAAVAKLTSLTDVAALKELATLSAAEAERLSTLEAQRAALKTNDPKKAAAEIRRRAERYKTLHEHLTHLAETITEAHIQATTTAWTALQATKQTAEQARDKAFPQGTLPGTGDQEWQGLWNAARAFSPTAYPKEDFPAIHDTAQCLLCQQQLDDPTRTRLQNFEGFVTSDTQHALTDALETFQMAQKRIADLNLHPERIEAAQADLADDNPPLATTVNETLAAAAQFQEAFRQTDNGGFATPSHDIPAVATQVAAQRTTLEEQAAAIDAAQDPKKQATLEQEHADLAARQLLKAHLTTFLKEIERLKRVAAYGECRKDTDTHAITAKSTELTKSTVTDTLIAAFKTELNDLKFKEIAVELNTAGGQQGTHYHHLVLTHAKHIPLKDVASEGESRCLAIASFFAELSTADDASALLFDDPVSSLDHKFRTRVANRLVAEAKTRQVIVFTHDLVFLIALKERAEQEDVRFDHQSLTRTSDGFGVCYGDLPWDALSVKQRIGVLKSKLQETKKHATDGPHLWKNDVKTIYGLLRETWERAIEEVLLGGAVQRYRKSIETKKCMKLDDITPDDLKIMEAAMTKTSALLTGHDTAPAENPDMPQPDEVSTDISQLETWVKTINQRRG